MAKHAGIARFTYNWGLATWQDLYNDGLKPNKYILKKFFNNHVKPELTWMKEKGICQKITQYAFDSLGEAFQRFFQGQSKYPNFKSILSDFLTNTFFFNPCQFRFYMVIKEFFEDIFVWL